MFDKMKQLMEMKKQADQIKKELEAMKIEFNDIRGIKISINGSQVIQQFEIDESLMNPANKRRFVDDLKRSINGAIRNSQNLVAQKMKDVMPGFPGL